MEKMKEIEKIIKRYHEIDWTREKVALGTVVKVEGSAYRRIGARIFVSNNGQWVGGISGGCLEGDALKQAKIAIMKNESSIVVYDTTEDDPHQIGVGLGCNGRIEVLFTPIDSTNEHNQIRFLEQITNKRNSTILLQVLNIKNGNQALRGQFYTPDDFTQLAENIGVDITEIEANIETVFYKRKSNVFILKNEKGGVYEVLFELIRPKIKLICIGDNYDVNAILSIAKEMGWEIHVAGKTRKISRAVYKMATKVYALENAKTIPTDEYTAIVLMSHDYKTDLNLLKEYIHFDVPYIGLLGPKKRMFKMQDDFIDHGLDIDLDKLPNLYSPVGLDIGAESPEEIALSIVSEIIAVFRERNGGCLRYRKGSIHKRT